MNASEAELGQIAVIGLGLMGRSIVACLLAAGHHVAGITNDLAASAQTPDHIRELLKEMKREALLSGDTELLMSNFVLSGSIHDAAEAVLVIESITEDLELKRSVLRDAEAVVSDKCILATNTSALPVSLMQEGLAHPERVIGIHWDEPAHVTRFMEIIPGNATDQALVQRMAKLASNWGKEPCILRKEVRGFIANRISYAMFREACHLVDSGVCTVEDVDRSLRYDVGWWIPFVGPFRYMDLMGPEVYGRVMKDLLPDLSSGGQVPKLMSDLIESGGRGIKNGRGFYQYTEEEAKVWEAKFLEFNYKIRRLTAEYSDVPGES